MEIRVRKLKPDAKLPTKSFVDDACFDLYAYIGECDEFSPIMLEHDGVKGIAVPKGEPIFIGTGLSLEIPRGYYLDIRPRSGLAKQGFHIFNSPGTIDAGYRGEVKVLCADIVYKGLITIFTGDRIAQCVLKKLYPTKFVEVECLSESERGESGFGSTGH